MDDSDQTVTIGRLAGSDPPAGQWADHWLGDADAQAGPDTDGAAGLASLSFIVSSIRRRARYCCLAAVCGLLLGSGLYLVHPPPYQATTMTLLTLGPNQDPQTAIQTDAALALSRPVAARARHQLGISESVSDLLTSYTATPVTERVLQITVRASSAGQAVSRANALTAAFLHYRAAQLRAYEQIALNAAAQPVSAGTAHIASLETKISNLSGQTLTPAQSTKLAGFKAELTQAKITQTELEQSARQDQQSTQSGTTIAVQGSYVVDSAALVQHSRKKTAVIYAATGLIGFAILGVGLTAVLALMSDKLRRRDDIALALGAPVRFSTGQVRLRRLLPGRRGLAEARIPAVQRIAGQLRAIMPADPGGTALAVVPADRTDVAALALVALAVSCATEGQRVMVADLCPGAPAGRVLGVKSPGTHQVEVLGAHLTVVLPERDDAIPVGPLAPRGSRPGPAARRPAANGSPANGFPANGPAAEEQPAADGAAAGPAPDKSSSVNGLDTPAAAGLATAFASTDVLLTLAALDPMIGAEHLATWSSNAVVMVTAGRSSWTRTRAVGEMIRLAGIRLVSATLIGADRRDESLGMMHLPRSGRPEDTFQKIYRSGDAPFARVNGSSDDASDK